MGIRKANVFPEPVQDSTETSLFYRNKGITIFYTGIILSNLNFPFRI